ncbi:MAG TPA: O-antigen ligase family protein [Aggregatilineales bacterium]|nr:O-antigen ligase family protein [Aggregatilineales bacterium]
MQRILAILEPSLIAAMFFGFWFATPTRDSWLWLLAGIPVVMVLRWRLAGRAWPTSPLNCWLLGLALLGMLNVLVAPFNRAPANPVYAYTVIFARVWLGIALVWWLVALAKQQRSMAGSMWIAGGVCAGMLLLATGSTAWTTKSNALTAVIQILPQWGDGLRPLEASSFNPNEIAGALALLTPLAFSLAIWAGIHRKRFPGVVMAIIAGGLLLVTILGQSRFALAGISAALILLLPWAFSRWRFRYALWVCMLLYIIAQGYIILRPTPASSANSLLNDRDSESMNIRFELWISAVEITRTYPLTGAGANMYRDRRVRALFPTATYGSPPHAHNAWLQMSADMGLPGLVLFLGIQLTLTTLIIRTWQQGDPAAQVVALGVGGGLLAHTIYSMGDAVPLWDRLAVMYWLLAGLAAAQYALVTKPTAPVRKQ